MLLKKRLNVLDDLIRRRFSWSVFVSAWQREVLRVIDQEWLVLISLIGSLSRVLEFTIGITDLHPICCLHLNSSTFGVKFVKRLVHTIIVNLPESSMLHELDVLSTS